MMKVKLKAPQDGALLDIHTKDQTALIEDEDRRASMPGDQMFKWDDLSRSGEEQSLPPMTAFSWSAAAPAVLEISRDPSFETVDYRAEGDGRAEVTNFLLDTEYYWRVLCEGESSETRRFHTSAQPPRFLYVDGITNVRDIGGWKTTDGKKVRQGLIYRCSELDSHVNLTKKGIRTMVEELGIRCDLDQRGEAVGKRTESVLSPYGVEWCLLPMVPYDTIFNPDEMQKNIAKAFAIFADADRYPICFHCWGGADRGGTLAFLLEAALGIGLADLYLDFELTSLSIWDIRTRNYPAVVEMMRRFDEYGDENSTIKEKVSAFLLSIGVTQEQLDSLRDHLLE